MKFFSRFPVFRIVIPYAAGIFSAIRFQFPVTFFISMAVAGFIVSFLFTKKNYATGKYATRWLAGIPFYCCFFGLGATLTWFHQSINYVQHFSNHKNADTYLVTVEDEPHMTRGGYRFIASVTALRSEAAWHSAAGKISIFLDDPSHQFKGTTGNKILIAGKATPIKNPTNPNAFNPRNFYAGKGTWHQIYVAENKYEIIVDEAETTLSTYARMLRDAMLVKLKRNLGDQVLGVAGALLLGYEDWLDPELEDSWSGAGVLHVLCVSGMHVMLIYVILAGMLGWMERSRFLRHVRYLILLLLIWFYAMVTGFSPSVIRAAAMISFVIAGNWLNREASIYNLLCSSCILMFTMDPYLLISAGFQLSFLAVCGIIFFHKMIFPLWIAPNTILHKMWELVSVSIAAQLTTFPLSLYLFHQFPNYFLVANLLIIPLSTLVMYSGLLLLVTDWIPCAGNVFGYITSIGIQWLNWLVVTIGNVPGALTENVYLNGFETICLYLLLIIFPVWIIYKSPTWLFTWMTILAILLSERIYVHHEAATKAQLVVYESRGSSIIALIHDRKATILKDSLVDAVKLRYSTKEHLISCLVNKTTHLEIDNGSIITIGNYLPNQLIILREWGKKRQLPHGFKPGHNPILVLGGNLSVEANELIHFFNPSLVIFDHSCKSYQEKKLASGLIKSGIRVHRVSEEGAYVHP